MSGPTFRIPEQLLLPWSPQKTISVQRVAEMLDCSHDTVARMIEEGALTAYRLRERSPWRVYYDSVLDYLDRVHSVAGLDPRYQR
jgi:excisionase family DNA binding protein